MKNIVIVLACFVSSVVAYAHEWNVFAADEKPTQKQSEKTEQAKESGYKVIMFTASWCGPCQQWKRDEATQLKKTGWKIGTDKDSHFQTVDVDNNKALSSKYNVTSIPVFVLINLIYCLTVISFITGNFLLSPFIFTFIIKYRLINPS